MHWDLEALPSDPATQYNGNSKRATEYRVQETTHGHHISQQFQESEEDKCGKLVGRMPTHMGQHMQSLVELSHFSVKTNLRKTLPVSFSCQYNGSFFSSVPFPLRNSVTTLFSFSNSSHRTKCLLKSWQKKNVSYLRKSVIISKYDMHITHYIFFYLESRSSCIIFSLETLLKTVPVLTK